MANARDFGVRPGGTGSGRWMRVSLDFIVGSGEVGAVLMRFSIHAFHVSVSPPSSAGRPAVGLAFCPFGQTKGGVPPGSPPHVVALAVVAGGDAQPATTMQHAPSPTHCAIRRFIGPPHSTR